MLFHFSHDWLRPFHPHMICMLLLGMIALSALSGVAHGDADSDWRAGPEMEAVLAERPWETKALTPVEMKPVEGLDAIAFFADGKPALPLVIPGDDRPHHNHYRQVAGFLADYLKQATGAEFATVHDTDHEGAGLFIGPCRAPGMDPLVRQAEGLNPEHLIVARFGGGIALLGRDIFRTSDRLRSVNPPNSRGTFFAAVDFVERFVGVRFYLPGRTGIYVPYARNQALVMPAVSYADGPAFQLRSSSTGSYLTKDHEALGYDRSEGLHWQRALRTANFYLLRSGHTDTNWHDLTDAGDNPQWFALRADGTRMIGDRGSHSSQRCYTDESAFRKHIEAIAHFYKTGETSPIFRGSRFAPNERYIYWWPNDGFPGCHCDGCMALTDLDAPSRQRHSRLIWTYTKRLAEEIEDRWPDKVLIGSFYATWHVIPEDIELPDNVTFMLVETREPYHMIPAVRERALHSLESRMAPIQQPITLWSHYPHRPRIANRMDAPYQVPEYLQKYVQWQVGRTSGVYQNGHHTGNYALDGLMPYLYHKLLWNPDLDWEAMLAEYCHVMFGPEAGPLLKDFYDTIVEAWQNTAWWKDITEPEIANPHGMPWTRYYRDVYPTEMRNRLQRVLSEALNATGHGTAFRARVQWLVNGAAPFFAQGALLDRGGEASAQVVRMTPALDGELDDWAGVQPLVLKNNINGEDVAVRTEVFTAWDDENFYVAFHAQEPGELDLAPEGAVRNYPLWRTDSVEIFLCAERHGDEEAGLGLTDQYHQIILDANGNVFDGYRPRGAAGVNSDVNIHFEHVARKTEDGFVIELAIPFASLNAVKPEPGKHWIANFYRNRRRAVLPGEPLHSWAPTLRSAHATERFGRLVFTADAVAWKSDFAAFDDRWSIHIPNEAIQVQHRVENVSLRLHVTSGQMEQGAQREIKISYRPAGRERTFVEADVPVALDWRWRYSGQGLWRIRAGAGGGDPPTDLSFLLGRLGMYNDTGWVVSATNEPGAQGDVARFSYCFFALRVDPHADFKFDVDFIRLLSRGEAK